MLINEKSDSPITFSLVVSDNFLLVDLDVGILGSNSLHYFLEVSYSQVIRMSKKGSSGTQEILYHLH